VDGAREKYKSLYEMDTKGDHLELVPADLVVPGSYDDAVKGCDFVIHTASPYILTVSNPQKELVEPAVQGTLSVMEACHKAGVKKVVLTSSVAAITDSPENGVVYTEEDWNTTSSLKRNPYYYSKKKAEEAAWEFVKEHTDLKLVAINPFMVIGPHLGGGTNSSTEPFIQLLTGGFPGIIKIAWGMVDVRDVAKAHILLMEKEEAEGRHICWNTTMWLRDVVNVIRKQYPQYPLPKTDLTGGPGKALTWVGSFLQEKGTGQYLRHNLDKFSQFDQKKLNGLGFEYMPIEQSILDTCENLITSGHVPSRD